jgi:hypothetical protein
MVSSHPGLDVFVLCASVVLILVLESWFSFNAQLEKISSKYVLTSNAKLKALQHNIEIEIRAVLPICAFHFLVFGPRYVAGWYSNYHFDKKRPLGVGRLSSVSASLLPSSLSRHVRSTA